MPFDEISIDLPELINQPNLCLNSMHRRAIPSIQIKTQTTVLVRENRLLQFSLFFICWETKWSIWLFLWNKKTTMKTLKIATNLQFQNHLFYAREAWCEFVFVTLHRTSLYCDVGVMVNIKINTFSEQRMIEVDYVKISLLKIHTLKSYRPKHSQERYFFWTRYLHNS